VLGRTYIYSIRGASFALTNLQQPIVGRFNHPRLSFTTSFRLQLSVFLSTISIGLTIATPSGTIEEGPNKVLQDLPSRETEASCIVDGECRKLTCIAPSDFESCSPCGGLVSSSGLHVLLVSAGDPITISALLGCCRDLRWAVRNYMMIHARGGTSPKDLSRLSYVMCSGVRIGYDSFIFRRIESLNANSCALGCLVQHDCSMNNYKEQCSFDVTNLCIDRNLQEDSERDYKCPCTLLCL